MASLQEDSISIDTLDERLKIQSRIEELPDTDDEGVPFPGKGQIPLNRPASISPSWLQPAVFGLFHIDDGTTTMEAQQKTTAECLSYLTLKDSQDLPLNLYGLPHLRRKAHADFLRVTLGTLPAPYAAMDASRPWLFYWTMAGLTSLGEDVSGYRERLMETVRPLQNPTGGFGGGHGQLSHCACTYATVLALTCVGGLEVVDRTAMWRWLGEVKQADGGFKMALGAEEDIRGAYCAMTILALLNLPLELPQDCAARKTGLNSFTDKLGEWVSSCQTYEGGIAGAPTNEAHGAYAFCALACLSILDAPHKTIPRFLNIEALIHWLASMQTTPEGGFAGRTNKLVDACYSHWVGGCWSLLQAATKSPNDLWSREGLIRYLLTCCQQPGKRGGMRDKPSTRPDGYHTCYSLAGLSAAQNHYHYHTEESPTTFLSSAFQWSASRPSKEEMAQWSIEEEDRVRLVHPVFVVPMEAVERARLQFEKGGL
ncbi:hypothetical protein B0A50_07694 [Salinomyces thailandicus]|uniref:Protein farnesyltransferase subunit beta n=1 Tax=Salinomyces thailandicus TaxID=706561 RepID=A0A4U0TMI5_9PEZI|nr:hypothetical protein B0A50_07694 [Salinomyces thailandica]